VPNGGTATFIINNPKADLAGSQLSSPPLRGNVIFNCPDPLTGEVWKSNEMGWATWEGSLEFDLARDIPHLASAVRVWDLYDSEYSHVHYRDNAVAWMISFQDYEGDVPQCYLTSGSNNPLTGLNPTFDQKTIREYGKNLFHEPIPMELLYSDATSPQVLVTIDDLPVACPALNCDYVYTPTSARITGQSVVGRLVTIDGTGLPTSGMPGGTRRALTRASPFSVMFGGAQCGDDTFAATGDSQITCTLGIDPEAGSHTVQLRDENGLIPVDAAVSPIDTTLSTDAVSTSRAELN
jgi:hypothetical protein